MLPPPFIVCQGAFSLLIGFWWLVQDWSPVLLLGTGLMAVATLLEWAAGRSWLRRA